MKPNTILALAAALAIGGSLAMSSGAEAAKKRTTCAMATGEGTGITEALARSNAASSLNNVVNKTKVSRTGPVKTTCKKGMVGLMTTCTSSQRFCS